MKYYRLFDNTSGLIHPMVIKATSVKDALAHEIQNHSLIEGEIDHLSQRVDVEKAQAQRDQAQAAHREKALAVRSGITSAGESPPEVAPVPFVATAECLVDYQPPQPSADHEWNPESRRWTLSETVRQRNEARTAALARIAVLEAAQLRPMRELALNPQNAEARQRLEAIETEIAGLRSSP